MKNNQLLDHVRGRANQLKDGLEALEKRHFGEGGRPAFNSNKALQGISEKSEYSDKPIKKVINDMEANYLKGTEKNNLIYKGNNPGDSLEEKVDSHVAGQEANKILEKELDISSKMEA